MFNHSFGETLAGIVNVRISLNIARARAGIFIDSGPVKGMVST